MPPSPRSLALVTLAVGLALGGIFAAAVVPFGANLRGKIRQAIIERDAAVLHPVALQQLAELETASGGGPLSAAALTAATLRSSRQLGMLAVVIFDPDGEMLQAVPASLILPELAAGDYLRLIERTPISRLHPTFALDRHFHSVAANEREAPVLEVLLPLHGGDPGQILGFVQYFIDARGLMRELTTVDSRIQTQTTVTLGAGWALIALLGAGAYLGLRRAHRQIAERSERLVRANLELTLAAKTSALGQITSHLIHGLQGPVEGLRALTAARPPETDEGDWQSASNYIERLERLVQETVGLLSDVRAQATYELTDADLVSTLRQRFDRGMNEGTVVTFSTHEPVTIDNHRGSLLCLITSNLIQNAIEAKATNVGVGIGLKRGECGESSLCVTVRDDGPGISAEVRARLFEPGASGHADGSGLGLAISRLLARQVDANLDLEHTGPEGTGFALTLPRRAALGERVGV